MMFFINTIMFIIIIYILPIYLLNLQWLPWVLLNKFTILEEENVIYKSQVQ